MSTFTFFVSILLGSTFANAEAFGKAASAQSSMSEEYIKSLMGDITKLQDFNKNFKINPKTYCPQYSGNDSSLCMKNYISSTTMKSSTEIVLFSTTVVGANIRDEKLGFSSDEIKLLMVDNLLTLFEKVKVSDFRLAKLSPKTPTEKLEVQMLMKDDQKMLSEFKVKIVKILDEKLAKSDGARQVANIESWKIAKRADLLQRLDKFKKVKWEYAQ